MADIDYATAVPIPKPQDASDAIRSTVDARSTITGTRRRLIVGGGLLLGDLVAAVLARELVEFTFAPTFSNPTSSDALSWGLLLVPFIFGYMGLYDGYGSSPVARVRIRVHGIVLFVAFTGAASIYAGVGVAGLLKAGLAAPFLLVFSHYGEALVRSFFVRRRLWGARLAFFGGGDASRKLAEMLIAKPELGLYPIAFLQESWKGRAAETDQNIQWPFCRDDLEGGKSIEVLLFPSADALARVGSSEFGRLAFPRVIVARSMHDLDGLWLYTCDAGSPMGNRIRRDLFRRRHLWLKRLIDCLIAVPVAVLALPVIALLALIIKAIDPGPAFYQQTRVGLNGKLIRVLKLRTMYVDAESRLEHHLETDLAARAEWIRFYKLANDPRVLPKIGQFMRKSSLDELPQLLNVIQGSMSLIGPRPFPAYHMAAFDTGFQKARTSVPPGLTGIWQVFSRSDGDLVAQRELDLCYIRHWSIWLDLYILLQTVPAVFCARGAK